MRRLLLVSVLGLAACPTAAIHRETCTRYVGCALAADAAAGKDVELAYGDSSACWGDDRNARACVTACEAGIKTLQAGGYCKDEVKP